MVRPVCGSPPRGRGKVAGAACRDLLGGITPAWAGKRRCTAACNRLCWDHPRVGGEKIDSLPHRALYLGSPPRGRGKAHLWIIHQIFIRITPAWAGKSHLGAVLIVAGEDHPRVGGEKPLFRVVLTMREGSPPRGRGKDPPPGDKSGGERITPAWAGKSGISHAYRPRPRDHPRVGGEKSRTQSGNLATRGSPPRGRGKAWRDIRGCWSARITPAWAGKSYVLISEVLVPEDHPRVGGEKSAIP